MALATVALLVIQGVSIALRQSSTVPFQPPVWPQTPDMEPLIRLPCRQPSTRPWCLGCGGRGQGKDNSK